MAVTGALERALEWYVKAAEIEVKMMHGVRLTKYEYGLHDTYIREARAVVDRFSLTLTTDAALQSRAMKIAKEKRPRLLEQGSRHANGKH